MKRAVPRRRAIEGRAGSMLRVTIVHIVCALFFLLMTIIWHAPNAFAGEKWQGVDETVVEKIAKEHGREATEPLLNTDKGDLLLFVFLLAGTIGGFAAGYYWRSLTDKKKD